jgi:BASS family bile acid:Na+ symporter
MAADDAARASRIPVLNLVELVMLSVGLRTRPAHVLTVVRQPAFLAREILVIALGIPLLTIIVVKLLPVPQWTAIVALLFGISPAAPALLTAYRYKSSVASKALAVISVALASSIIVVPVWLVLLNRFLGLELRVPLGTIVGMLALKAFAPLLTGMLIAHVAPRVARGLDRVVIVAVAIGFLIAVVLLFYLGAGTLRLVTPPLLMGLLLIAAGSALLGELAGGRDLELREILARVAMAGNPAIALAIIATSYPDVDVDLDLGGLVAAFILARALASIPYTLLARVRLARRAGKSSTWPADDRLGRHAHDR